MDEIRRELALAFARDVEGKIRQALIELGWAPPSMARNEPQ